jgi:hypothetical protein
VADLTLNGGTVFPEGTSVGVYPRNRWGVESVTGAPSGSAVATGTITGGTVTFTGLSDSTEYIAYAASPDRYKRFSTPPVSAGSIGAATDVDATTIADARVPRWDGAAAKLLFERAQRISVLNPRFGANTGTGGSHVDTAAFQAAVNFCINNSYVLEIPRPPVQYRLDDTIVMQPQANNDPTFFNLDIDASSLSYADITWVGANNKSVFLTWGLRRSYWRGLKVRVGAVDGVTVFDINCDATRSFSGPNLYDNILVSSGSAPTNTRAWRFSHGDGVSSGSGGDGQRFRGCEVNWGTSAGLPGTGSVGWVNENINSLGFVFEGGGVSNSDVGWTNLSSTGAVQASGGNCMFFLGVETTNNNIDFDLATAGGYSWEGGRFETGRKFLYVRNQSGTFVLPIKGITLAGYTLTDGKMFDIQAPSVLSIQGMHAKPSSGLFTSSFITLNNPTNADSALTLDGCAIAGADPPYSVATGKWRVRVANSNTVALDGTTTGRFRQRGPGVNALVRRQPRLITPQMHIMAADAAFTPSANAGYTSRFVVSDLCDLVDIAFKVSVAASVDDPIDIGIYQLNAAGTALTRMVTKGPTTGLINSPGIKSTPLTGITFSPEQVYYVAMVFAITGTNPTLRAPTMGGSSDYADLAGSALGVREFGNFNAASNALPATITTLSNFIPPFIAVGVS